MNRAAPVQLRHKNLVKGSNLITLCIMTPSPLVWSFLRTQSPELQPEWPLSWSSCQDNVSSSFWKPQTLWSLSRLLCLGFLIIHLEDRKRTLARVARLWPALGPCSCLEPTPAPQHTARHHAGIVFLATAMETVSLLAPGKVSVPQLLPSCRKSKPVTHSYPLGFPNASLVSVEDAHGASQVVLVVKNPPANAGDLRDSGSILGLGKSSGEENGNPLQYVCLENPIDSGAWQAMVLRVSKSRTQLKQLSEQAKMLKSYCSPILP